MQHSDNEVEGGIRVAHNEEQRRFPVAQGVQLQFVVRHDLPQLRNIEGGKAGAAANQDGFQGLARDKLSRTFLSFFKKQPCNKMLQGCFFEINIPLFMHL